MNQERIWNLLVLAENAGIASSKLRISRKEKCFASLVTSGMVVLSHTIDVYCHGHVLNVRFIYWCFPTNEVNKFLLPYFYFDLA